MSSHKKKIVMPTPEEVEAYKGPAEEASDPGKEASYSGPDGEASTPPVTPPSGAESATTDAQPARSEADEYKDKYLRAVAELSNYRKRSEKDREDALRYANVALVRSLLSVLDNLERVIASAQEHSENAAAILEGAEMTADSFRKVLREHHVVPIEAEGKPFDPAVHEAMMQQPSDQYDTPTVLQVVQEGYKLHDRVVRPARVIVSKPASEEV